MSVTVRIPTPLRRLTGGQDKVEAEGQDLSEVVASLESEYPGIKARLCDDSGELRTFVNIYVDGEGRALPRRNDDRHRVGKRDQHRARGRRRLIWT